MTNLEYIIQDLNNTPIEGVYKAKEIIRERINTYKGIEAKINAYAFNEIENYSFSSEVLRFSELRQKQSYKKRLLKKVVKLERHAYAPELNALHFKDSKVIKTPQRATIEDAINEVINTKSLIQIKEILN